MRSRRPEVCCASAGPSPAANPDTAIASRERRDDIAGYTQCHFFAGIGIWSYALRLAGWPDDRQVWTGSCPCQPFSAAGKGEAFNDERHDGRVTAVVDGIADCRRDDGYMMAYPPGA